MSNANRVMHGLSKHRVFRVHRAMMSRCYNPKDKDYINYGGRGITICDQWKENVAQFVQDMGLPEPGQSIERLDNNGPYSLDNCVWADRFAQNNNSRINRLYFVQDCEIEEEVGIPLTSLARFMGADVALVQHRIWHGWDIGRAICVPKQGATSEEIAIANVKDQASLVKWNSR